MARNYAQILTSIWADEDFLALSGAAQRMYFLLLSQANLNFAGVVPLQKRRWAKLCAKGTVPAVGGWLSELEANSYVVIDEDTEELLVRSFIRNAGVWRQPNLLKAALRDAQGTLSGTLRRTLSTELGRLPLEELTGKRAGEMKEQVGRVTGTLSGTLPETPSEGFPEPIAEGIGEGIPEGSGIGTGTSVCTDRTSVTLGQDHQETGEKPPALALVGRPPPKPGSDGDPDFAAFWDAYPRKIGKPSGRKAWRSALKRGADPKEIIRAAERYAADPTRSRDPTFTPHPSTWLNDERYADQPERRPRWDDVDEIPAWSPDRD